MAYAGKVDQRLHELLPPSDLAPEKLHEAMRYSCLAPGKRLRPALCLACAEAVGGPAESALDAGCAIEMVHSFSLIHDDLPAIDDDELRRGSPSCHVRFGEATAILAGDALFALAFQTLSNAPACADTVLASLRLLTAAVGTQGLVGGEAIDISSEGSAVDEATLERIHAWKTGSLIAASCTLGALFGGGDAAAQSRFAQYGRQVGLAFQIADDILDEVGTSAQLGKAAGSDRMRGKATYPALHGIDRSRAAAREHAQSGVLSLLESERTTFLVQVADFAVERLS
jgi:geranylgeranyl diphosphate synthase type II